MINYADDKDGSIMTEQRKGKLKIFFGYCAGVGKTYTMLSEAHTRLKEGVDVVIGYVERHDRSETIALMDGLEQIPEKNIQYHNVTLHEFDIDAALERKPALILVDELAHTNAIGSRHPKRYSDIQELLHAGIDVYTTVNVQHLESLHDVVAALTRILVNERIPDKIFDMADSVELVDIEPEDLIQRLYEGKIYKKIQAKRALENFFIRDNLIALREIALRRCADRVNKIANVATRAYTKEHIMVCLSSSPSNAKVIRTASRMAAAFHGVFTALFVETPHSDDMEEDMKAQLRSNIALAQELGASIISVFGEDIAEQISEYAKISGISKIVIGRSSNKQGLFHKANLVDTLTTRSPNLDIYIIPDRNTREGFNQKVKEHHPSSLFNVIDTIIMVSCLIFSTLIGIFFANMGYTEANIIMIYLLAVLLISFMTTSRIYGIAASVLIVFTFNFFFTDPRYTFQAYDKAYPVTFAVMLFVSIITNTVTRKLRQQSRANALQARRTEILLETSQKLQLANTMAQIARETCIQLYRLLERTIIIYSVKDNTLQPPILYNEHLSDDDELLYTSNNEQAVAQWVFRNNKNAGVSTRTLPAAKGLYYSIRMRDKVYAVAGIAMKPNDTLSPFEKSLLTAMLNEIALAMDSMSKNEQQEDTTVYTDGI